MSTSQSILNEVFGFTEFRSPQKEIIDSVIFGDDIFALMPTGAGKSLCYQIPAVALQGTAVVISPLIALMKDQVDFLKSKNIKAEFLNSSLDSSEQSLIYKKLISNQIKILYVSPERFSSIYLINILNKIKLSLFAIDEAHCVSQWGHDFRPEYQIIGSTISKFINIPTIALTATADTETRKDIIKSLRLDKAKVFVESFDRPNIKYIVHKKKKKELNRESLLQFIKNHYLNKTGIIYCLSRKSVEEVSEYMNSKGLNAYPYHARLSNRYKSEILEKFINEEIIIVATIAFGMGIDKSNVRFVAHLDMPKSLESYYQETGRAGRDGKPSTAIMFYGLRDLVILRKMNNSGNKNQQQKILNEDKLQSMLGYCETLSCRRLALLNYFSDHSEVICNNCDSCLGRDENKIEVSKIGMNILICIYETNQKLTSSTIMDILTGHSLINQSLKSFGILNKISQNLIMQVYRELVIQGFINSSNENVSIHKLTKKSIQLINQETKLYIVEKKEISKKKIVKKTKRTKVKQKKEKYLTNDKSDETLFKNLKIFRTNLAKSKRTKAFKICPDKTLYELAKEKPQTLEQLEGIYGIGPKKLKRFGNIFLNAVEELS